MKTELYYFSGTGNGLNIAKTIESKILENSNENKVKLINIGGLDLTKEIISSANIVGIIYPVYFLEAPRIVRKFTEKFTVKNNPYLFLYTHFGAMYGNAVHTLKKILEKKEIAISSTFVTALPDNSIIFPTKPDLINEMLENGKKVIEKNADEISSLIQHRDNKIEKVNYIMKILGKSIETYSINFLGFKKMKTDNSCTGCSICTKVCPVKNIKINNNKPEFNNKCEMCFACLHNCPKQSIKFKRMKVKDNYQYKHPNVNVSELG